MCLFLSRFDFGVDEGSLGIDRRFPSASVGAIVTRELRRGHIQGHCRARVETLPRVSKKFLGDALRPSSVVKPATGRFGRACSVYSLFQAAAAYSRT